MPYMEDAFDVLAVAVFKRFPIMRVARAERDQ